MNSARSSSVSPARRRAVIDALRRGAVPEAGLDLLATGLDRFESAVDAELDVAPRAVRRASHRPPCCIFR